MSIKKRNLDLGEGILELELEIMDKKASLKELQKKRDTMLAELRDEEAKVDKATLEEFDNKPPNPPNGNEEGGETAPKSPKTTPRTPSKAKKPSSGKKGKGKAKKAAKGKEEPPPELMKEAEL